MAGVEVSRKMRVEKGHYRQREQRMHRHRGLRDKPKCRNKIGWRAKSKRKRGRRRHSWVRNATLKSWWWASWEGPKHESATLTAVFERGRVTEEGDGRERWKERDTS